MFMAYLHRGVQLFARRRLVFVVMRVICSALEEHGVLPWAKVNEGTLQVSVRCGTWGSWMKTW